MKAMADHLRDTMYNGSWMGRGGANFKYMAGGHLNAAGLHAVNALSLRFDVTVKRDGKVHELSFQRGVPGVAGADRRPL